MKSKYRFVIDTNTLISAVLIEGSVPDRALRRARAMGVLLVSPDTLDEAVEVLSREKFDRYVSWEPRQEFLEALADQSVVVEPVESIAACRGPDDNKVLEVAVESTGSNPYPGSEGSERSDAFQAFIDAVQDLVGGRPV